MSSTSTNQTELLTPRDQLHRLTLLVRRSMRHLWKGVILVVIGTALSLGLAITKKRIYVSESVVLYRQVIRSTYIGGNENQAPRRTTDVGQRLRELLVARQSLEAIIKKHDLYRKTVNRLGYVEAVNEMRRAIEYRVGGGDTFHIAFKGPTPEIAQQVTKQLADSLIAEESRLRTEQVGATLRFLEAETDRVQKELQTRETDLAEFLAGHPEFAQEQVAGSAHLGAGASIRAAERRSKTERRGDTTEQTLRRHAARIKSQLVQGKTVVRVPPDPKLVAAKELAEDSLREARRELSRKQDQFTNKHPDVVGARARVQAAEARAARVNQALKASRAVQRTATPVDRAALEAELARTEREIGLLRRARRAPGKQKGRSSRANTIVALETQWNKLNRQVKEARERYLRLEDRQFRASLEASSEVTGQAAQMTIIDPAYLPTKPASVGRTIMLVSGFAVSCLLATILLLGLGLMDERIYDRLDIERLGLAEVLVEIPRGGDKGRQPRALTGPSRDNAKGSMGDERL